MENGAHSRPRLKMNSILCKQVFLTEYAGPLVIYLLFYARPAIIYGADADFPRKQVVKWVLLKSLQHGTSCYPMQAAWNQNNLSATRRLFRLYVICFSSVSFWRGITWGNEQCKWTDFNFICFRLKRGERQAYTKGFSNTFVIYLEHIRKISHLVIF